MKIYHITDTHYPRDNGLLAHWITQIRSGEVETPDAVVHSGDIVDGADNVHDLRKQLMEARSLLDQLPCPYYTCCHSHDRFGEPILEAGKSYREVFGQDFVQCRQVNGTDLILVSGSITADESYLPVGYQNDPPSYAYCLYDEQVVGNVDAFLTGTPRSRHRLLFYHIPIVPYRLYGIRGNTLECPYECIGEEGRSRILPLMDRHGIQTCFGGHVHLNSYREVNRKHFITTASFVNRPAGYRVIELEGSELRARWVPLPADGLEPVSAHLKEDLESSEGIHFRFFDGDTHEQDVRLKLI